MWVSRSSRRAVVAALAVLLAAGTAGAARAGAAPASSPLGPPAPAKGTPVKIGLISDGGNCPGCMDAEEEPAAKAAASWANEYMTGLAGHPITVDVCIDNMDPGTAIDCANQMIRDNVAAVVIGADGVIESPWNVLHNAHIPVINDSNTITAMLQDATSTFVLNDSNAFTVSLPLAVAKQKHAKIVSVIVVDLPIATDIYSLPSTLSQYKQSGVKLEVVPAPLTTPDMTPQAQRIVATNPNGVASIVGDDPFCLAAFDGLKAVAFHGTISAISYCFTEPTTVKQVPASTLKGMVIGNEAPVGDSSDASMRQYKAVLQKYANNLSPTDPLPMAIFRDFGALSVGTRGLQGAVTPTSVIAALKAMNNEVMPFSGTGRIFRCNGKASASGPAVCSRSVIASTLGASGTPSQFTVENNEPIPN